VIYLVHPDSKRQALAFPLSRFLGPCALGPGAGKETGNRGLGHCHCHQSFRCGGDCGGASFASSKSTYPEVDGGMVDFERAQVSRWTGLKRFRTAVRVFFASQPNTFHRHRFGWGGEKGLRGVVSCSSRSDLGYITKTQDG
jgi:hypothetical protein